MPVIIIQVRQPLALAVTSAWYAAGSARVGAIDRAQLL